MVLLVSIAWVLAVLVSAWLAATVVYMVVWVPRFARNFTDSPWLLFASPATALDVGEEVSFRTGDDRRIQGTLLSADADRFRGGVVLCHELTGCRWNLIDLGQRLRETGFDVLLFDFCNHGESDRVDDYKPLPWVTDYEVQDVEAALTFMEGRLPEDAHLWVYGMSKGGNAGMVAAARRKRLALVVADSTFPTMPMVEHYFRRLVMCKSRLAFLWARLPGFWLRSYFHLAVYCAGRSRGCRFLNVMRALPRIQQPVLLIRGSRDRFVTEEVTSLVHRQLPGQTSIWRAPNAKHNGAFASDPDLYFSKLIGFVNAQLLLAPAGGKPRDKSHVLT